MVISNREKRNYLLKAWNLGLRFFSCFLRVLFHYLNSLLSSESENGGKRRRKQSFLLVTLNFLLSSDNSGESGYWFLGLEVDAHVFLNLRQRSKKSISIREFFESLMTSRHVTSVPSILKKACRWGDFHRALILEFVPSLFWRKIVTKKLSSLAIGIFWCELSLVCDRQFYLTWGDRWGDFL